MKSNNQQNSPLPIDVGCGDYLFYFLRILPYQSTIHGIKSHVHVHFYVEVNNRNGGYDCPLPVALIQVLHGKDTVVCAVYARLHS
jgi:hypothetical protein